MKNGGFIFQNHRALQEVREKINTSQANPVNAGLPEQPEGWPWIKLPLLRRLAECLAGH